MQTKVLLLAVVVVMVLVAIIPDAESAAASAPESSSTTSAPAADDTWTGTAAPPVTSDHKPRSDEQILNSLKQVIDKTKDLTPTIEATAEEYIRRGKQAKLALLKKSKAGNVKWSQVWNGCAYNPKETKTPDACLNTGTSSKTFASGDPSGSSQPDTAGPATRPAFVEEAASTDARTNTCTSHLQDPQMLTAVTNSVDLAKKSYDIVSAPSATRLVNQQHTGATIVAAQCFSTHLMAVAWELIKLKMFGLAAASQIHSDQCNGAYLIAHDADNVYLAFRGSQGVEDWLRTDFGGTAVWASITLVEAVIEARPTTFGGTRVGDLHPGFETMLSEMRSDVLRELDAVMSSTEHRSKRLIISGHSLGGAIAELFLVYLQIARGRRAHLVTDGAPRVGDYTWKRKVRDAALSLTLMAMERDLVPDLPGAYLNVNYGRLDCVRDTLANMEAYLEAQIYAAAGLGYMRPLPPETVDSCVRVYPMHHAGELINLHGTTTGCRRNCVADASYEGTNPINHLSEPYVQHMRCWVGACSATSCPRFFFLLELGQGDSEEAQRHEQCCRLQRQHQQHLQPKTSFGVGDEDVMDADEGLW